MSRFSYFFSFFIHFMLLQAGKRYSNAAFIRQFYVLILIFDMFRADYPVLSMYSERALN